MGTEPQPPLPPLTVYKVTHDPATRDHTNLAHAQQCKDIFSARRNKARTVAGPLYMLTETRPVLISENGWNEGRGECK